MILVVCFAGGAGAEGGGPGLEILGLPAGPHPRLRWHDPDLLTIQAGSEPSRRRVRQVEDVPGVKRVVLVPAGGGLFALSTPGRPVSIPLGGGVVAGGGGVTVIAGPCGVESEEQICEIATAVKAAGARALRGGAFKPRTSPYSFGGLGETGLEYLARARHRTGLPVVTEVLDVDDLDLVAHHADVLQIGARNMHNYPLLYKAGRHVTGRPVLLKRGFGATLRELLHAAEYVLLGRLGAGRTEPGLILCERGIRTFEDSTRFTLDLAAIPVLQERSRLPVIVDPCHAAGERRLVPALARAAVAAGADGLLLEVHPDPDRAWSDSRQCLGLEDFRELMRTVDALAALGAARARAAT